MLSGDLAVLNPKEGSGFQNVPVWAKFNLKISSLGNLAITDPDGNTTVVALAAALTQSITLFTLPVNSFVHAFQAKSVTPFVGTTTLTFNGIGVTGTLDYFDDVPLLYDLMAAVTATNLYSLLVTGASADNSPRGGNLSTAAIGFIIGLISTVTNLSTLSAGEFNFWVQYSMLP